MLDSKILFGMKQTHNAHQGKPPASYYKTPEPYPKKIEELNWRSVFELTSDKRGKIMSRVENFLVLGMFSVQESESLNDALKLIFSFIQENHKTLSRLNLKSNSKDDAFKHEQMLNSLDQHHSVGEHYRTIYALLKSKTFDTLPKIAEAMAFMNDLPIIELDLWNALKRQAIIIFLEKSSNPGLLE
jgi:hypothetical protein